MSDQPTFLTDRSIELIRGMPELQDCSEDEVQQFLHVVERTRLDPLARQIYGMRRGRKLSITVSIDGFRLVAERTGDYAGQDGPFWCGDDGTWRDVWLAKVPPAAAKVGVLRKGFATPLYAVARWGAYAQQNSMWQKLGDVMLAKCAEMQAIRRAFPAELSGIYGVEEMEQAGVPAPAEREEPASASAPQHREVSDTKQADDLLAVLGDVDGALLHRWVADVRRLVPENQRQRMWDAYKLRCAALKLDPEKAAHAPRGAR